MYELTFASLPLYRADKVSWEEVILGMVEGSVNRLNNHHNRHALFREACAGNKNMVTACSKVDRFIRGNIQRGLDKPKS